MNHPTDFREYCKWFLKEERQLLAFFALNYERPPKNKPEMIKWIGISEEDKKWYIKNIHPKRKDFEYYMKQKQRGVDLTKYYDNEFF